jgi:hypothetical protein
MGDVELTTEATDQAFSLPDLARIAKHLTEIGIPVRPASLGDDDQLPGVRIEHGSLLVDESKLLYPGDVVHEAAHIAVMPPSVRAQVVGALPHEPGEEMAALAWSYALAVVDIQPKMEGVLQKDALSRLKRIERFFNQIRHFPHIARRCEKLATNYLAFLNLATATMSPRHLGVPDWIVAIDRVAGDNRHHRLSLTAPLSPPAPPRVWRSGPDTASMTHNPARLPRRTPRWRGRRRVRRRYRS